MSKRLQVTLGFLVGVFAALGLFYWLQLRQAQATFTPKVYICHCEQPDSESPFQCQTLHIAVPAALFHLAQHDADYSGQCEEPEPSPSSFPSPSATSYPDPSPTDEPEPSPSDEPEPSPSQTTDRCEDIDGHPCGWSPPLYTPPEYKPPVCTVALPDPVTPKYEAIGATSVKLSWEADNTNTTGWSLSWGYDKDNLPYGLPDGKKLEANTREYTVNGLQPNTTRWFELARWNGDECVVYGQRIDP